MYLWSDCYPDQKEDNLIAVECPCCTECWPVQPEGEEEEDTVGNNGDGDEDEPESGGNTNNDGGNMINRKDSRFDVLSCNNSNIQNYSQTISSMTLEFTYKVETLMKLQDLYPLLDNVILDLVAPWLLSCDDDNRRRLMSLAVRHSKADRRFLASSSLPGVGTISSVPRDVFTGK
jgi:hypothetical protein